MIVSKNVALVNVYIFQPSDGPQLCIQDSEEEVQREPYFCSLKGNQIRSKGAIEHLAEKNQILASLR